MKKRLSLLLMVSLMALLSTQSFALFGFGKKKDDGGKCTGIDAID